MLKGLKLFWGALRWWEKTLVVVGLPLVLAALIALAIISRGTNRMDRDVENQLDDFLRRTDKRDEEHKEKIEELDDEITTIIEKKAAGDKEAKDAIGIISECASIDCVDDLLRANRERRRQRR